MRGGVWSADASSPALPTSLVDPVRAAAARSRDAHGRVVAESPAPSGGTLIVSVRPVVDARASKLPEDALVFVAYVVRPLPSLRTWQEIVALLAAATALLVGTAIHSVVTVNRGAAHKLEEARVKEEQLARELSQNERLAALGRVAAGVAHEVRNPLASIKLRLDLAASSPTPLPPAARDAIGHATSEIDRLDRLVADLLVVAGRKVGPKGRSDLGDLVRSRVDALAAWAGEKSVELTASGEGLAVVDADALARAVDNLLRNGVEAAPAGSRVAARVELADSHVVVRIEDQGLGVAADRTAELFEPFFTTKPGGTGLGLAISRAIARAHGGDVVYAHDDVTCFTLSVTAA
jgi:signal transduction histidine kinase